MVTGGQYVTMLFADQITMLRYRACVFCPLESNYKHIEKNQRAILFTDLVSMLFDIILSVYIRILIFYGLCSYSRR